MTVSKLYRSKDEAKLANLHPDLARVVHRCAANGNKFIVVQTMRGRIEQNEAHRTGHSNAKFGQSPHNYNPALAIDIGPPNYPGNNNDYLKLKAAMFAAAEEEQVHIVWGGDWHSIIDRPHFELANWRIIAKHEKLAE